MADITLIYGEREVNVTAAEGELLGDVVTRSGLPLEQPCAGRGTCGKCKVLVEPEGGGLAPPDEIEFHNLTLGEMAVGNRLACRARSAATRALPWRRSSSTPTRFSAPATASAASATCRSAWRLTWARRPSPPS
jgi:ferredoxin